jgi:hypothetical protein
MTAVLGGNVRAEIVSSAGIRLQRISLRQATTDLLLPRQPEAPRKPPMLGGSRCVRGHQGRAARRIQSVLRASGEG